MASGTSYFNPALYRKTVSRFWPLWAAWGLLWMLLLPLLMVNRYVETLRWSGGVLAEAQNALLENAVGVNSFLQMGVLFAAMFGVLAAMAVFSYLYTSRSACMMHALPLRRESLFLTQYLSGLSFLILPLAVVALCTLAVELVLLPPAYWGNALPQVGVWLVGESAVCLFFFSFASFCAMFTGHILALPVFYGVFNGLVMVVHFLVVNLMEEFFYGYVSKTMPQWVEWWTPLGKLSQACSPNYGAEHSVILSGQAGGVAYYPDLEDPQAVAVYAVVGLVLTVAALAVYRRRHVESAGDVVSVALVRPVFRCGVAFCSGLCLGVLTSMLFGWYRSEVPVALIFWVLAWTAVGYFVAEMLLRKSFRVWSAWKGGLGMVAVMALLCAVCVFDLFGVETRVPSVGKVESVHLDADAGYPYDDGSLELFAKDDPELISRIIALHQAVVDDRERASLDYQGKRGDEYVTLRFQYILQGGGTMERTYHSVPVYKNELSQEDSLTWQVNDLLQDRALVEEMYNFDSFEEGKLTEIYLSGVAQEGEEGYTELYLDEFSASQRMELWQAMRSDFDEGTIGVRYLFDDGERLENTLRTDLTFVWEVEEKEAERSGTGSGSATVAYSRSVTITLTPDARHTLSYLEQSGALEGHRLVSNQEYWGGDTYTYYLD